jgi:hypothetical protein
MRGPDASGHPWLAGLSFGGGCVIRFLSACQEIGRAERSVRNGDPGAQVGEHGSDATRAPPLGWVPSGEVAYRIEREQPHEDPRPDAEKVP